MEPNKNEVVITLMLRSMGKVAPDNDVDVEALSAGTFHAIEKGPHGENLHRYVGLMTSPDNPSVFGTAAFSVVEEPELTLEQLSVFYRLYDVVAQKLHERESAPHQKRFFTLLRFGDFPEVFDTSRTAQNIAGNVRSGMEDVWHSIDNIIHLSRLNACVGTREGATTSEDFTVGVIPLSMFS